jgi:hypothetical protein
LLARGTLTPSLKIGDHSHRHDRMSRKLDLRHVDERSSCAALGRGHFFR